MSKLDAEVAAPPPVARLHVATSAFDSVFRPQELLRRVASLPTRAMGTLHIHPEVRVSGLRWSGANDTWTLTIDFDGAVRFVVPIGTEGMLRIRNSGGAISLAPFPAVCVLTLLRGIMATLQIAEDLVPARASVSIEASLEDIAGRALAFDEVEARVGKTLSWDFVAWNSDSKPCVEGSVRSGAYNADGKTRVAAMADVFDDLAAYFLFQTHHTSSAHTRARIEQLIGVLEL